jgi:hypothetical protein
MVRIYEGILGIEAAWFVEAVDLKLEAQQWQVVDSEAPINLTRESAPSTRIPPFRPMAIRSHFSPTATGVESFGVGLWRELPSKGGDVGRCRSLNGLAEAVKRTGHHERSRRRYG